MDPLGPIVSTDFKASEPQTDLGLKNSAKRVFKGLEEIVMLFFVFTVMGTPSATFSGRFVMGTDAREAGRRFHRQNNRDNIGSFLEEVSSRIIRGLVHV